MIYKYLLLTRNHNHGQHGQHFLKHNSFSKIFFWKKRGKISLKISFLLRIDYIKATELLDRLPTVEESDLPTIVELVFHFIILFSYWFIFLSSLSAYLDDLSTEYFNELLIRRLFVPFMFLCSSTRSKLIPRILTPKTDDNNTNSWISIDKYRTYVIPLIIDLFSYHVTCIRETLLEYFNSYWQLIDKTILRNTILPQVKSIFI
jgi:hypothetical protein